MAILAATLVLLSPFALTLALSWIARRNNTFRIHLDQFRVAAPLGGTFAEDRDPRPRRRDMETVPARD